MMTLARQSSLTNAAERKHALYFRRAPTPKALSPVPATADLILQRKSACACGGGCPRCREQHAIQPKLTISMPGDRYEQEADQVAEQIMQMPDPMPSTLSPSSGLSIQRKCAECISGQGLCPKCAEEEMVQGKPLSLQITPLVQRQVMKEPENEEEEETLQAKEVTGVTPSVLPSVESHISDMRSGGQPLPESVRAFFEPRFGYDFSQVRVHTDSSADFLARHLHAEAFTVGHDIFFRGGRFASGTSESYRLLAHELTHIVQQRHDNSMAYGRSRSRAEPELLRVEQEANSLAQRLAQAKHRISPQMVAPRGIYCQRSPFEVRFPTLEIAALRGQAAFATGGSPLLSDEISDARSVFGSSIDLSRVRIVYSPVISAPTTLGDTIRIPPAYAMPRRVLIHELTHIWQFQTKGSAYISDSLFHQAVAFLTRGDRGAAYDYIVVPGKSFHDYTAEQQASIVEDYFAYPSLRANAEYQRLIGQVRAASPIVAPIAFFQEMAAGLPPRGFELLPLPGVEQPREGAGVPQLEIRFPGL